MFCLLLTIRLVSSCSKNQVQPGQLVCCLHCSLWPVDIILLAADMFQREHPHICAF